MVGVECGGRSGAGVAQSRWLRRAAGRSVVGDGNPMRVCLCGRGFSGVSGRVSSHRSRKGECGR